eukprot:scaffold116850_cov31-Prasinocladus_malaysianus.AAC.3
MARAWAMQVGSATVKPASYCQSRVVSGCTYHRLCPKSSNSDAIAYNMQTCFYRACNERGVDCPQNTSNALTSQKLFTSQGRRVAESTYSLKASFRPLLQIRASCVMLHVLHVICCKLQGHSVVTFVILIDGGMVSELGHGAFARVAPHNHDLVGRRDVVHVTGIIHRPHSMRGILHLQHPRANKGRPVSRPRRLTLRAVRL